MSTHNDNSPDGAAESTMNKQSQNPAEQHFSDFARNVDAWIAEALEAHARQQATARWVNEALEVHRAHRANIATTTQTLRGDAR